MIKGIRDSLATGPRYGLRYPRAMLALWGLAVLVAALGLPKLSLRTDGAYLVPPYDPDVLEARRIRQDFRLQDPVALVVEATGTADVVDGDAGEVTLFQAEPLAVVVELTSAVSALPGVDPESVVSIATDRIRPVKGGRHLRFVSALDPRPRSAADIKRAARDLLDLDLYRGTLLSVPEPVTAAAVLVGLDGFEDGVDRREMHRRLELIAAAHAQPGLRIHVVGAPIAESILGLHLLQDLSTLIPVTILLMALVFGWRYRSWSAVMLPLLEVGACLICVFGAMGHLGIPISLPVTVLPVILTAAGVLDEIHVFDRFLRLRSEMPAASTFDTLGRTLAEMTRPVVATSLTTAVAFLSFCASPLAPVRHFGAFSTLGVLLCMMFTLTAVPALLSLIPLKKTYRKPENPIEVSALGRRSGPILGGVVACALLAIGFGLSKVRVDDSWIGGFAPSSPFHRSAKAVDHLFHGSHLLILELDAGGVRLDDDVKWESATGEPGAPVHLRIGATTDGTVEPATLIGEEVPMSGRPARFTLENQPDGFVANFVAIIRQAESETRGRLRLDLELVLDPGRQAFLASQSDWTFRVAGGRWTTPQGLDRLARFTGDLNRELGDGGGALGVHDQLSMVRRLVHGGSPKQVRSAYKDSLEVQYLLSVLRQVRGTDAVAKLVDEDGSRTVLTVFLKDPTFRSVAELMSSIRHRVDRDLAPAGIEARMGGDVAVSQAMIRGIVHTQISSLFLSLLGTLLVTRLLTGTWGYATLCVLPALLGVAAVGATLGLLGIPLGVATSMFSAMGLGLGIDFAVHLVERFRHASATTFQNRLHEAIRVTNPPIILNSTALVLGFGALSFSQVPANHALGLLMIAVVLTSLATTLVLLPFGLRWLPGPSPTAGLPTAAPTYPER